MVRGSSTISKFGKEVELKPKNQLSSWEIKDIKESKNIIKIVKHLSRKSGAKS